MTLCLWGSDRSLEVDLDLDYHFMPMWGIPQSGGWSWLSLWLYAYGGHTTVWRLIMIQSVTLCLWGSDHSQEVDHDSDYDSMPMGVTPQSGGWSWFSLWLHAYGGQTTVWRLIMTRSMTLCLWGSDSSLEVDHDSYYDSVPMGVRLQCGGWSLLGLWLYAYMGVRPPPEGSEQYAINNVELKLFYPNT